MASECAGDVIVRATGDVIVDLVISRTGRWLIVIDQKLVWVLQAAKLVAIVHVERDGRTSVVGENQSTGAIFSHVE